MEDRNFLPTPRPDTLAIPLPLIVLIAVCCYMFIIIIGLIIKQCLQSRGVCGECQCCGGEGEPTCQYCVVMGQTCNCFQCRGVNTTLDRCCPRKPHVDCVDIILCQCCAPDYKRNEPLCGAYCANRDCCGRPCCCRPCCGRWKCSTCDSCHRPPSRLCEWLKCRICCEYCYECDWNCGPFGRFHVTSCACCTCEQMSDDDSVRHDEPPESHPPRLGSFKLVDLDYGPDTRPPRRPSEMPV